MPSRRVGRRPLHGRPDDLVRAVAARRTGRRATTSGDERRAARAPMRPGHVRVSRAQRAAAAAPGDGGGGSLRRPQPRDEQHDQQVGDDVDDDVERPRSAPRAPARPGCRASLTAWTSAAPMPGVGEDRLDHDDAADQPLQRQREHLHGRRERVAQRVLSRHAPLADAVQPRHLDVVGGHHLDDAGADHADRERHGHDDDASRRAAPAPSASSERRLRPAAPATSVGSQASQIAEDQDQAASRRRSRAAR